MTVIMGYHFSVSLPYSFVDHLLTFLIIVDSHSLLFCCLVLAFINIHGLNK